MAEFLANPFDEAERLVQERGKWIVATVDPRMSWPTRMQLVTFENKDYVLFPLSEKESAGIALRADLYLLDRSGARQCIMRFCSALCWSMGAGIEILTWGGGAIPRPIHMHRGRSITDFLETDHLPEDKSERVKAILALYREGMSLDNPFYAFFSFYKAISVAFPKGKERARWIENALKHLDNDHACKRRDELLAENIEIGEYIWNEGRNAIAHADREPFVNPDEMDDHFRLQKDIPLLRNLAELAIEQKADVQRTHTIWKNHLYELEGFRGFFSQKVLDHLRQSTSVPDGETADIPRRCIVAARKGPDSYIFNNMRLHLVEQVQGGVLVDFLTDDEAVTIRTILNFAEERMDFDPLSGLGFTPNRKDKKHVEYEILLLEFQRCILGNGHLEVWDEDTKIKLGESKMYMPLNCFINEEFFKEKLDILNNLLADFD